MAKQISLKRIKKTDREHKVLLGVVELYLKTGKAIGSNTLHECGFADLSSATIRNYFAHLEEEGYLQQPHVSGGRLPTAKALQFYADQHAQASFVEEEDRQRLRKLQTETQGIAAYLHTACELLSEVSGYASFMSSPRFDHDFVLDIKLIPLDQARCLCVMVTDFGAILTEILPTETKLTTFTVKRIEEYFSWKITNHDKPSHLTKEELAIAHQFYTELMLRYITRYSSFSQQDVYRTGFSLLLNYPEFSHASALASSLCLFENEVMMHTLLRESGKKKDLCYWIGDQLASYLGGATHCSVITIPYHVQGIAVGCVGLLGPTRLPYQRLFGLMRLFSEYVSDTLTKSLYRYKIQYRQPSSGTLYLNEQEKLLLSHPSIEPLED